jgi:hypothetical protein
MLALTAKNAISLTPRTARHRSAGREASASSILAEGDRSDQAWLHPFSVARSERARLLL